MKVMWLSILEKFNRLSVMMTNEIRLLSSRDVYSITLSRHNLHIFDRLIFFIMKLNSKHRCFVKNNYLMISTYSLFTKLFDNKKKRSFASEFRSSKIWKPNQNMSVDWVAWKLNKLVCNSRKYRKLYILSKRSV